MSVVVVAVLVVALALASSLSSTGRPDAVSGELDGAAAPPYLMAGGENPVSESQDVAAPAVVPSAPTPVDEALVSQAGTGQLSVVAGSTSQDQSDESTGVVRYRVMVEDGLTVSGDPVDGTEVAAIVHDVLTDSRGWGPLEGVVFQRVPSADSDVDVVLASPETTDALCAPLGTGGWLSCFNGSATVLNARRWFSGVESYGLDLVGYRRYLVSHEMGHYLGHQHEGCPAPGAVAPVMVQQTKSLDGCTKGPWPSGA